APESVAEAVADRERKRRELEKELKSASVADAGADTVVEINGVQAVIEVKQVRDPKALPDIADRIKNKLRDPAVVVIGAPGEGRVSLLVAATPGAVERG